MLTLVTWSLLVASAFTLPEPQPDSNESSLAQYDDFDETTELFPLGESSSEMYAKEFPYGQAMARMRRIDDHALRKSSRRGRAHVRIIHKISGKPRNYAKKYRTWKPAKEFMKPVDRKGTKKMHPPMRLIRDDGRRRGNMHKRRKVKPVRSNHLRRPTPPPEPDYDYLSGEAYFPEETKRTEERRPYKKESPKRKRPKPDHSGRLPDAVPSVSYSNFIQHPASTPTSVDYHDYYSDEQLPRPKQKDRRRKKKKKKGTRKRIRDEDQSGAYSESSEEVSQNYEKYPPYADEDQLLHRRPARQPQPVPTKATPIYGDGYLGNQNYQQNAVNRNNAEVDGLSRYQNEPSSAFGQGFTNPPYEPTHYNRNRQQPGVIPQQNYNQYQNTGFGGSAQSSAYDNIPVTQANYNIPNNYNQQQQQVNTLRPTNYHQNYQTVGPLQSNNAYQNNYPTTHEYSSKYKSSSFFDNTETFQDFNRNVDYSQQNRFGANQARPSSFVPSNQYQEPSEGDSTFINRHIELYSNGMKGVPVQGDGFGGERRQENRSKDFDIGYGEIQYDETHTV